MNIHLIYSEKPTRLVKIYNDVDKEEFTLKLDAKANDSFKEYVNVYITPDGSPNCVLTTDKLLIADGVQEIPEEFLKWYVDNPSCEEVEVNSDKIHVGWEPDYTFENIGIEGSKESYQTFYRIIIPNDQPDQDDFSSKLKEYYKNIPKDKVLEDWSKSQEFDKIGPEAEEVVRKPHWDLIDKKAQESNTIDLEAYSEVIEWIKERMYSHEEVNNLISDILYKVRFDYSDIDVIESNIIHLFENFKKK